MKKNSVLFASAVICGMSGFSQQAAYAYQQFYESGDTLHYRMLVPPDFDPSKKYPLLVFLHGAGERGNDNEAQLIHGSALFADSIREYPAVVVFPQCSADDFWPVVEVEQTETGRVFSFPERAEMNPGLRLVNHLVDSLIALPEIDKSRVYIAGLSMGAMGTYELVAKKPDTFAAAVAICGGGNENSAAKYARTTPFWILHGEEDEVVSVKHSRKMHRAISDEGGNPKLTIYPGINHNSWDPAFAEPQLLQWIFSHNKQTPPHE